MYFLDLYNLIHYILYLVIIIAEWETRQHNRAAWALCMYICSMLTQYIKGTASAITIDTVWMNIIDSCPVPVYTNESH